MSLHYFPQFFFVAISVIHQFRGFIQQSSSQSQSQSVTQLQLCLCLPVMGVDSSQSGELNQQVQAACELRRRLWLAIKRLFVQFFTVTHIQRSAQCAHRQLRCLCCSAAQHFVPPTPLPNGSFFLAKEKRRSQELERVQRAQHAEQACKRECDVQKQGQEQEQEQEQKQEQKLTKQKQEQEQEQAFLYTN